MNQVLTDKFYSQAYFDQVRLLYRGMPASLIANILTAILLVAAQWVAIHSQILVTWFSVAITVVVLRGLLFLAYKKIKPGDESMSAWGLYFNTGSSLSALVLGSAGVFLFPENNPLHQVMCAFVLVGMASGALSSLSYGKYTYPLYLSLILAPLFLSLTMEGTELSYILMLMLILAYVFMLKSGMQIHENSEQNIILRLEAVSKEEALEQAQQKHDLHIKSTPMGVIEWDVGFCVTEWNPSAEKIFGYSREEALGKNARNLILTDEVIEHVDEVWEHLLNAKGGFRSRNENIRKDGKFITCEWYNTPLKNNDGVVIGVASLVEDITERVQAENELWATKEEAEKANRAKSDFLSRMSHELRTPMNAVLGFAQLLEVDLPEGRDRDNAREILKSGRHLLDLIDEVLDLSRIEEGKLDVSLTDINLGDVMDECIRMVSSHAKQANVKIINHCISTENYIIYADQMRFKQVILNLLSNAIKYNKENGKVIIECKKQPDQQLRLLIADTGIGMTNEQRQQLFKPFERMGAEKYGIDGTGIGLLITRQLIEKMNGGIGVSTEAGKGSTFWIDIGLSKLEEIPC